MSNTEDTQIWKSAEDLPARIKDVRENVMDLTQVQFAWVTWRQKSSISAYENKATAPEWWLRKVAELIQLPVSVFQDGSPMPSEVRKRLVNGKYEGSAAEQDQLTGDEALGVVSQICETLRKSGACPFERPTPQLEDDDLEPLDGPGLDEGESDEGEG